MPTKLIFAGSYEVTAKIGEGGMGEVYQAQGILSREGAIR